MQWFGVAAALREPRSVTNTFVLTGRCAPCGYTGFHLTNNPALRLISGTAFGVLTSVEGGFRLANNNALPAIDGSTFEALATVGGNFHLSSNPALRTISGTAFGVLASVEGSFQLTSNNALLVINSPAGKAVSACNAQLYARAARHTFVLWVANHGGRGLDARRWLLRSARAHHPDRPTDNLHSAP